MYIISLIFTDEKLIITCTEKSGKVKSSSMTQEETGSIPLLFLFLPFMMKARTLPIPKHLCQTRYILQFYCLHMKYVAPRQRE